MPAAPSAASPSFQPLGYIALLGNDNKRVILPTAAAEQSQLVHTLLQGVNAMQLLVRYDTPASLMTNTCSNSVAQSCEAGTSSFHSAISRPAAVVRREAPALLPDLTSVPLTEADTACTLCAVTGDEESGTSTTNQLHTNTQVREEKQVTHAPLVLNEEEEEHDNEEVDKMTEESGVTRAVEEHRATVESMYFTLGVPYVCGELVQASSSINERTASLVAATRSGTFGGGNDVEEEQQNHVLLSIPLQCLPFHSLIWVAQYAMVKATSKSPEAHTTQVDEFFQDVDSPMSTTHIMDLLLAADLLII